MSGDNMSEKRQHFIKEFDWIRKGLMFEPRGHDMMSGAIFYPPSDAANDIAILFIETSGCLPMCGHGTIGAVTIGVEEGLIKPRIPGKLSLETPAGIIKVDYEYSEGKVKWVRLRNVKSFLAASGLSVACPNLGELQFDVAYGGNFYAIIDPQKNYQGLDDISAAQLVQLGPSLRARINEKYPDQFVHPEDSTIRDVSHLMWTGNAVSPQASSRNAVFYGDKAIDRSPCGTGTSARMAQWYARGKLKPGEEFIHESIIGSHFIGKIEEETILAGQQAIIPSIQGWAKIYGYNTIIIDDSDPYATGFQVR